MNKTNIKPRYEVHVFAFHFIPRLSIIHQMDLIKITYKLRFLETQEYDFHIRTVHYRSINNSHYADNGQRNIDREIFYVCGDIDSGRRIQRNLRQSK